MKTTRLLSLVLALFLTVTACGDDPPSDGTDAGSTAGDVGSDAGDADADEGSDANSCELHGDCPLGKVCNYQERCVIVACANCADDPYLVCRPHEEYPEGGVCSRPECSEDDECDTAAGETCNEGVCESS